MSYQNELRCIRCESVGTIRKIKVKNIIERGDEYDYFVCTNCKTYAGIWESMVMNAEDFPIMLDEEWERVDDHFLDEKVEEEDMIDLNKTGEDLEKELDKIKDPELRKYLEDQIKGGSDETKSCLPIP